MESWSMLTALLELLRKNSNVTGAPPYDVNGKAQVSKASIRAPSPALISPLQALQLIQREVKNVGHVVVGGPAAGQLVLRAEGHSQRDALTALETTEEENEPHIRNGILEKPLGLPLSPLS